MTTILEDQAALVRPASKSGSLSPTAGASDAIRYTSSLVHSFWHKDIATCLSLMDSDVVCLGFINRYGVNLDNFIDGKRAVASMLRRWQETDLPQLTLKHEKYSVSTLDSGFAVLVKNTIIENSHDKETPSPHLSIIASLVWTHAGDGTLALSLCHLSSSLSGDVEAPNDIPANAQTPDIAPAAPEQPVTVPARRSIRQDSIQIKDVKSGTHWVTPASIVYVAAEHQYTIIHCLDREIKMRGSITSVCELLGSHVVRVHRSYAVNPLYVDHMKGEMLFLNDGAKIPIPTRNVRKVRLSLSKYFKSVSD